MGLLNLQIHLLPNFFILCLEYWHINFHALIFLFFVYGFFIEEHCQPLSTPSINLQSWFVKMSTVGSDLSKGIG